MSSLLPTYPAIFEPHTAPINRHVETVEREGVAWVLRYFPSVALSPGRLRKLQAAKFARLAARGLPRAPQAELRLVCDWITWLFFYDDALCDDVAGAGPCDPLGRLQEAQARMLAVLRGAVPRDSDEPLVHMLAELTGRTAEWANGEFVARFTGDVERYFQSNVWELRNLIRGAIPALPLYLKMRPLTGAACVVFDLIELTRGVPLAGSRQHAMIQQLELLANNAICWANDVRSLDKELAEHNPHNLVLALKADLGIDTDEALARAAAMQAAEEDAFDALVEVLPDFVGLATPEVRGYVDDVRSFIRGNLVWMDETMRYRARLSMRSYGAAA
jgi:5-epi-alpha-selinene synthase